MSYPELTCETCMYKIGPAVTAEGCHRKIAQSVCPRLSHLEELESRRVARMSIKTQAPRNKLLDGATDWE